ncbi:hypothetical protein [Methylophaga sulfidovorans]|uniref:Uncharacterized protein n=1 Tax=Methylophaga sulfidovorans TaxID=45496 RepID=A0A1I4ADF4_9GAMM|nr:hypothetical protein [Methylophaga sulfidovorans]SFK54465.1 hypothetical protein SAMN04488079_11429 [Methylophaga sulfidovorans]
MNKTDTIENRHLGFETNFWRAVCRLVSCFTEDLPEHTAIRAYIINDSALYLYTKQAKPLSIEICFSERLIIPEGMVETYLDELETDMKKQLKTIRLDRSYHDGAGLLHPDYKNDSSFICHAANTDKIALYVISPLDLAVSKLARYYDGGDLAIKKLADMGFFNRSEFESRAKETLDSYIGDKKLIFSGIRDATEYFSSKTSK